MKKILCVGSVTVDMIVRPASSVPQPGVLRAVDSVTAHPGGCAVNAAAALGKLGCPVGISCLVGNDMMGDFLKKTLSDNGVDCRGITTRADVPTTVSVVCVYENGERSFLYSPASAAAFTDGDIPSSLLDDAEIVFVAGALLLSSFDGEPCARFLKQARARGIVTMMDTAWDFDGVWLPKIKAALPHLDYFVPSYDEAVQLCGGEKDPYKIAACLHTYGPRNVLIKMGADGALVSMAGDTPHLVPTVRCEHPVDTTGAGDSFCAGFLCGLAQGYETDRAVRLGHAVAGLCITAVGASTAIQPLHVIQEKDPTL